MSEERPDAIVLDTETTGTDAYRDRVVEVAVVQLLSGEVLMDTLLDPCMQIPEGAVECHGIRDEDVLQSPFFAEIAEELASIINSAEALIGYNPSFDRGILSYEFQRAKVSVTWPVLVCAKRLWDKHEPRAERKLVDAHRRFVGVEHDAHRALSDVVATRSVLLTQVREFGLGDVPWDQFDPDQVQWIGPTSHLIMSAECRVTVNFGKHKGTAAYDVPRGYWGWLLSQDFPTHVLQLAWQLTRTDKSEAKIVAWIRENIP